MDLIQKQQTDRKSPEELAEQGLLMQTDPLPTEQQTDLQLLLKLVERRRKHQTRL